VDADSVVDKIFRMFGIPLIDKQQRTKLNQMKLTSKIAATFAVLALSSSAYAAGIVGGISLAGGYTVNTGNLNTATAFTSFSGFSTGGSGNFSPVVAGTAVTMTPFSFNPFPGAGVTPLWTVTVGPNTYSFNLSPPITVVQPGDNTLELKGTGVLNITGFTATPGIWIFTGNSAGGTFSYSSSNAANVPDGGATLALLGVSFLGLGGVSRLVRRK
jgi:hypothetical protein